MRHFSKQLMLTLVFVNLPTLLLANSIHTCPKSIAEITLLSWNLRGDGAFKPIPTGSKNSLYASLWASPRLNLHINFKL